MKNLRNIFAISAVAACFTLTAETFDITPGTLGELVGTQGATITELTLKGRADARDMAFIRDMAALKKLDMSALSIEGCTTDKEIFFGDRIFNAGAIPSFAFSCTGIEEVTLPSNLQAIGDGAFSSSELKVIKGGSAVTKIGDWAFYGCNALTEIELPATVATLGKGVFANCTALGSASLEKTKITVLPEQSFFNTPALRTIKLPSTLTAIDDEAFYGSGLSDVALSGNVHIVGAHSFSGMPNLESFQSGDIENGQGAFFNNPQLKHFHSEVTSVNHYGLAHCPSLVLGETGNDSPMLHANMLNDLALAHNASTGIVFGNTLQSVGKEVLSGMKNLNSVNVYLLEGNVPQTVPGSFDGIKPENISLMVDKNHIETWKADPEWGRFNIQGVSLSTDDIILDGPESIVFELEGNVLRISAPEEIGNVLITDASGMMLLAMAPGDTTVEIDITDMPQAVLLARAVTSKGARTFKFQRR